MGKISDGAHIIRAGLLAGSRQMLETVTRILLLGLVGDTLIIDKFEQRVFQWFSHRFEA
jgi:hypothetical protein